MKFQVSGDRVYLQIGRLTPMARVGGGRRRLAICNLPSGLFGILVCAISRRRSDPHPEAGAVVVSDESGEVASESP